MSWWLKIFIYIFHNTFHKGCTNFCTHLQNGWADYCLILCPIFTCSSHNLLNETYHMEMRHANLPTSCHRWHMVCESCRKKNVKAAMRCTDQTMPPRSRHLICAVKLAVNELESHCSNAKMTTAGTTHLWLWAFNQSTVHHYTAKKKVQFSLIRVNTLNRSLSKSSLIFLLYYFEMPRIKQPRLWKYKMIC